MNDRSDQPLAAAAVIITRPVGGGRGLARQVRALGGQPVLLPGLSLRAFDDSATTSALRAALTGDWAFFSSPAAVRFAAQLLPLRGRARLAAPGRGTARALTRRGAANVLVSTGSQDAAGLLAEPALQQMHGARAAVIGAAGGRGVLQAGLRERGAQVTDVYVYERVAARLDRRHHAALQALPARRCVLLSSAATLAHLQARLAGDDWRRLLACTAIVSSERLQAVAVQAGFRRIAVAHSALGPDLLSAAVAAL